ncbi:hypothetical protein R1CP_04170 [Rhodococcus opacus]|uniref:Uncharacterized protein n=1 Tax=Rhodococcus opacus TaxID=37919 RepID=A0A1B1JYY7_RHOOP|nr:hypothetical protein [Rhodococcus opacus]ANS25571.1 hypothetical protein R1CP_04170 [Rhodococcus opacus]
MTLSPSRPPGSTAGRIDTGYLTREIDRRVHGSTDAAPPRPLQSTVRNRRMREYVDFLGSQPPYDAPDSADLDALARTVDVEFFAARHTDRRGRRGPTR